MEEQYNKLTEKYNISAREYFKVLNLAIYHVEGRNLETSYETAQYLKTNEIYKCACKILKAMYKETK